MGPVISAALGIVGGNLEYVLALLGREIARDFGRRADDETAIGENFALGDERAGSDETTFADDSAVEHNGLNANQRALADRAAMHYRLMAHRYVGAYGQGKSGIRVHDGGILHIAARADRNGFVVAAKRGAEPDGGVLRENDFADHRGIRRDIDARRDDRRILAQCVECHARSLRSRPRISAAQGSSALHQIWRFGGNWAR